jgi:glycine/D-amino acid oxidase-like deaminating enzyme
MESVPAVVIGAGVVGLACARALARRGIETVILERNDTFGSETSARNSEVIHAGLYYPSGSLKAALCVAGRRQLYEFCSTHGVSPPALWQADRRHQRRPGRQTRGTAAAGPGLTASTTCNSSSATKHATTLEPELASAAAALLSPSTGIIDSHGADAGAARRRRARRCLTGIAQSHCMAWSIEPHRHHAREPASAESLQLARGDASSMPPGPGPRKVAASLAGFPAALIPAKLPRQRELLRARRPLAFLATRLSAAGGRRPGSSSDAGPGRTGALRPRRRVASQPAPANGRSATSTTALTRRVAKAFYAEIRRYWPGLARRRRWRPPTPGFARRSPGAPEPPADFLIQGPAQHGIAGLVNLFGIESPG